MPGSGGVIKIFGTKKHEDNNLNNLQQEMAHILRTSDKQQIDFTANLIVATIMAHISEFKAIAARHKWALFFSFVFGLFIGVTVCIDCIAFKLFPGYFS